MARISEDERKRFHQILDDCIDNKLNNEKNSKKDHWSKIDLITLGKMQLVESHELDLALFSFPSDIESECFDNIAIPFFIIDNLRRNKCLDISGKKI